MLCASVSAEAIVVMQLQIIGNSAHIAPDPIIVVMHVRDPTAISGRDIFR